MIDHEQFVKWAVQALTDSNGNPERLANHLMSMYNLGRAATRDKRLTEYGPTHADFQSLREMLDPKTLEDIKTQFNFAAGNHRFNFHESFLIAKDFFEKGWLASYTKPLDKNEENS